MSTILREITVWPGDTINHTYKVSGAGKLLGYWPRQGNDYVELSGKMRFDRARRKFETIAEEAESNAGIRVEGSNGKIYYIDEGKCSCQGFKFRGDCKHIREHLPES
jgi:hypothetical protein